MDLLNEFERLAGFCVCEERAEQTRLVTPPAMPFFKVTEVGIAALTESVLIQSCEYFHVQTLLLML
jgi:hypothetical protein